MTPGSRRRTRAPSDTKSTAPPERILKPYFITHHSSEDSPRCYAAAVGWLIMRKRFLCWLCLELVALQPAGAWGLRGHTVANLAAVEAIPANGPVFLKAQKAYIGHLGIIPDTWRSVTEPYLRISEDANHSWYTEGFDFIPEPPRSRTEFILRVHDEYLRVVKSDPNRPKLFNILYPCPLPYHSNNCICRY